MALKLRQAQSEDSESRSLLSEEQRRETSQYETFPGSIGSATELRFIILGGDEDLMDHACDIILRKRAERAESETRHREGHVCGRNISVVKTPSTWMSDVASCCCFSSRVKSKIKDQMLDYASLVFPGPHAFLLVTDNGKVTGRERYLLKTISDVLGEEALDYTMLLIIGRNEPKGISCVRNYVRRVYTLEDNEQSAQSLFIETETMTQNKESTFFIQPSYENLMKKAFLSWEKERYAEIKRETEKLLKEKTAKEVADLKEKLKTAKSKIKIKEDQHEQDLNELKEKSNITENNLKKDIDHLKCLILNTLMHLKSEDGQQKDEPGAASAHKSLLNQELEACIDSQATFINIFSPIIDGYIYRENELKEKLKESEDASDNLRNICSSMIDYSITAERLKEENEELKKTIERELKQTLRKAEDREAHFKQVETDLARREADVTRRETELEAKEREMAERETHLRGSESNICPGDERRESREEAAEASGSHESESGGFKHERRNSKEFDPPSMSGSERGPLDDH